MMWQKTCCCCSHSLTQVLLTSCSHFFFHTCVHVRSLSLFAHSVSHSWPTNNPLPSHSLSKRYILDSLIHEKGRKRQHPPSNTVNEEWSCVLWWHSIYTWEEGYWYWDRSNIAANEALLPGKWEKRWWTVEEIYEGLTINSKQNIQTTPHNTIQMRFTTKHLYISNTLKINEISSFNQNNQWKQTKFST